IAGRCEFFPDEAATIGFRQQRSGLQLLAGRCRGLADPQAGGTDLFMQGSIVNHRQLAVADDAAAANKYIPDAGTVLTIDDLMEKIVQGYIMRTRQVDQNEIGLRPLGKIADPVAKAKRLGAAGSGSS